MVGVVLIGRSFGNLCHYAWDEDKQAKILAAFGVRDWSVGEMTADFEAQKELRPRLNTVVLHIALSWPAEEQERMTDELMSELAQAYLAKMKINTADTQWAIVRHYDQDHPHCHIIVNRVTNGGKVLNDSKSFERSYDACRELESEYGMLNAVQVGIAINLKKEQDGLASPYEAAHAYIHEAVARQLPVATTVAELTSSLAAEGITMHSTYRDEKLLTVVFEREGEFVKGSAISKEFSGKRLRETLEKQYDLAQEKGLLRQKQESNQVDPTPHNIPQVEATAVASAENTPQLPAEVKVVPSGIVDGLAEETIVAGPGLDTLPVSTTVALREASKEAVQAQGQSDNLPSSSFALPIHMGESAPTPVPQMPSDAQRRTMIFRDAATGDWDSVDQAQELVRQMLTKALVTTHTEGVSIIDGIKRQGFGFNKDYTLIRHQESKLVIKLVDVQPGGPKALPFVEQVVAVGQANQAAERERARQVTVGVTTEFLLAKPPFLDREELTRQFAKVGLAASWPGQVAGEGGKLTLAHVALGHSFTHEELPVNGQPLLPQVQALGATNWQNPVRQAQIHYRDETQAAKIKADLQQAGVHLLPAESGSERAFTASYRLDSKNIGQIDSIFKRINTSEGTRVEESSAATKQREAKLLEHFMDSPAYKATQQWER